MCATAVEPITWRTEKPRSSTDTASPPSIGHQARAALAEAQKAIDSLEGLLAAPAQ
jgi:hypothetical protein